MKFKQTLKGGLVAILSAAMLFAVVGCDNDTPKPDDGDNPGPVASNVSISFGEVNTTVKKGDRIQLTVTVTGTEDTSYTLSVSDETLLSLDAATNTVTVIGDVTYDRSATVTATANADKGKKATKTFTIKAPTVEGQVGLLTSDMIKAIGNQSITVTGKLTDHYQNVNASYMNSQHSYDMTVKMQDGKWSGSWSIEKEDGMEDPAVVTDIYLKSEHDGYTNQNGKSGHALMRQLINKDNQVVTQIEKDYLSYPAVWEEAHLWNHLGNLNVNHFAQVKADDPTQYVLDATDSDINELYLLTYLSYSLTPLLEDTIVELVFTVDDGAITKLKASTEVLYDGGETTEADKATEMSWTTIELTFSEIGTTTVPDLVAYEAPEHAEYLANALAKMQTAKNYSYTLSEVTTSAPSGDSGDYELSSVSTEARAVPMAATTAEEAPATKPELLDHSSFTGTVGQKGWVTEEGILFEKTFKYQYVMEGQPSYTVSYTGYKPCDGYYEEFACDKTNGVYYGTKRVTGDMFDVMPKFTFSANLFEFSHSPAQDQYVFVLRESAITRDIAMQLSSYSNAKSAAASSTNVLRITVDSNGNLLSATFPYSLVGGSYLGYCTVKYSKIGTTELPDANLFAGYVEREVKTSWAQFTTPDYYPNHSTLDPQQSMDTLTAMKTIFGDANAALIPAPTVFTEIFGDNINKVFFNWREISDGVYNDYLEFRLECDEEYYDENGQMSKENYEAFAEVLKTKLAEAGFTFDQSNSGERTSRDRYLSFFKQGTGAGEGMQIVIDNNGTKWFSVYFYKINSWTFNR